MKQKLLRRMGALLLMVAMVLTMSAPAWAADQPTELSVTLKSSDFTPGETEGSGTLNVGSTGVLEAAVADPEEGASYTYDWKVDDDTVASVTQDADDQTTASVTGVKAGNATITVTVTATLPGTDTDADGSGDDNETGSTEPVTKTGSATFAVSVQAAPPVAVQGVTISGSGWSGSLGGVVLSVGLTSELTAAITPSDATDPEIKWTSSDPAVATVEASSNDPARATVTAVAIGNATITVTVSAGGAEKSAECPVSVQGPVAVTGVTLNRTALSVPMRGTAELSATVDPENAANKGVIWSSSSPGVARVDDKGVVTGVSEGVATITVTTADGNKTASCTVTVTRPAITKITLSPLTRTIDQGESITLTAGLEPADADRALRWSSSDSTVATVSATGVVTAMGPGRTTITATAVSNDKVSGTSEITVSGVRLASRSLTLMVSRAQAMSYNTFGTANTSTGAPSWNSSDTSVVSITSSGRLTARSVGTATITLTYTVGRIQYTDQCIVTVVENTAGVITGSAVAGAPFSFAEILDQLDTVCRDAKSTTTSTGGTTQGPGLSYITNLAVSTEEGILYYNHVSTDDTGSGVGLTERYYYTAGAGTRSISGVTFLPNSGLGGVATITYTGYNTRNESYAGTIRISVEGSGDVTYTTTIDTPLTFLASDFNDACRTHTGRELSYVTFDLPAASRGTLYYNYTSATQYTDVVTSSSQYYRTRSPYLDQVTFVPAKGYTGTVRLTYRGVDTAGIYHTGRVTIIIQQRSQASAADKIRYTAAEGSQVNFVASDFNNACQGALGESLSYVRFTLPSSDVGTLYYNYRTSGSYDTRVSENTRYYRSGDPSLYNISFVPAVDGPDQVEIQFVGYGADSGDRFDGVVEIRYYDANRAGVVMYTTKSPQGAVFEAADFNELCVSATGRSLNYVRFDELPAATQGTVYYNYTSNSSPGNRVSTTTRCYRDGTPALSRVAFVPRSGYVGTASIGFTGVDSSGLQFSGTILVKVEAGDLTLSYSVRTGGSVLFEAADFNRVCQETTGSNLNYVRFELPLSNRGVLYHRYGQSNQSNVTASTNYYRNNASRSISDVSFAADGNFTGTVTINYTGTSTGGTTFKGTVDIQVYAPEAADIWYTGTSLPVELDVQDILDNCGVVLDGELTYIQFNDLPAASEGRLYYNYSGYGTGGQVAQGARYYYGGSPSMERIAFVPKAGFEGVITLPYTAGDNKGETAAGTIIFTISSGGSSHFVDMGSFSWAAPSVEFLYENGVVQGISATQYGPGLSIQRCDFVLMLCRAFGFQSSGGTSFSDVPADSYYAGAVAAARDLGIVTGNDSGLFMPRAALTRQDAMLMLQRAMTAAGWNVPGGSQGNLSAYSDSAQIADYARDAVSAMVRLGVVSGNSAGQMMPGSAITRAEMAVILHRVLTL